MTKLLLIALLFGAPSFAEKTKTARPQLATPPAMEGCDASDLKFLIGATLDEALTTRARDASGATSVRVIQPGQMVSMDYVAERLNIEVDAAGKVISARCG
ncbi:hypothetical protein HJG53_02220 [Sphingomonas sp. ID1715]|uniref:I78 family peptidase inhibitor n=1 Tax=Sphingomonas sp. ID1715 TaxID=1656898 RepID=UPI001489CD4D|nr:I78 family peptidase inhibitor [Sphingomonas sp. ID1715]NNM75724.1 hypothetical protein [Sphingomonas sp. ID1715]